MSDRQRKRQKSASHQRRSDQYGFDSIRTLFYGHQRVQRIWIYADCNNVAYIALQRSVDENASSCILQSKKINRRIGSIGTDWTD